MHINSTGQPGGQDRNKLQKNDPQLPVPNKSNPTASGFRGSSHSNETENDSQGNGEITNHNEPIQSLSAVAPGKSSYVLLATARVGLFDKNGYSVTATALLDNGSQSCFISKELINRLNYQTYNKGVQISGIAGKNSICNEMVDVSIFPSIHNGVNNRQTNISCLVLNNITCQLPHSAIDIRKFQIPRDIKLADPTFYEPKSIDLLIEADVYYIAYIAEFLFGLGHCREYT